MRRDNEDICLKDARSGNTVQYGWIRRPDRAEALTGVVCYGANDGGKIRIRVLREGRMSFVELPGDRVVTDLGWKQEQVVKRHPLLPGML